MAVIQDNALRVIAAAILCSVVTSLPQSGTCAKLLQIISGIVMTMAVLASVVRTEIILPAEFCNTLTDAAKEAAAAGTAISNKALRESIQRQTEAYILDKAAEWGLDISVCVSVSDSDPPLPKSAVFSGDAPHHDKNSFLTFLSQQLEIPKENLEWTG